MNVIDRLAATIDELRPERRLLVAIDGPDAAGKTTLADELARRVLRPVVRCSIDDWHNPAEVRYLAGGESAVGYFRDAFDFAALVRELLDPFAAGAAAVITGWHDVASEKPAIASESNVAAGAALIVDGVLLQRQELRDRWHLAVYLQVPEQVSLERGVERDRHGRSSPQELIERYERRYLPGQALYRTECDPIAAADIVIDNSDPADPQVLRWT
jgi:uridine kinase